MKFGCHFQKLQFHQWKDAYIDYDGLKQLVKHRADHIHLPHLNRKTNNALDTWTY
jgi:SPX domain protein involved in polyphosphate accumulation